MQPIIKIITPTKEKKPRPVRIVSSTPLLSPFPKYKAIYPPDTGLYTEVHEPHIAGKNIKQTPYPIFDWVQNPNNKWGKKKQNDKRSCITSPVQKTNFENE